MNLYIVRHGQTELNLKKLIQGRYDVPLTDTGLEQAKEAKNKLLNTDIDLIICSPLIRTKQTADIINENRNIKIIYDDRIIERFFGELENTKIENIDFNSYWDYHKNLHYKNIETMKELLERVYSFLEDIKIKYDDKNILLVTHGGVGMAVECFFRKEIPQGSLVDAGFLLNNCEVKNYKY